MNTDITEKNINLIIVGRTAVRPYVLWIVYEKKTTKGLSYRDEELILTRKVTLPQIFTSKMRTTFSPRVIENPDGFGGLFALNSRLKKYCQPVLVSSTDGVGTKLKIAFYDGETRYHWNWILWLCV